MLSYVTMKVKSEIARDAIRTEHFLPTELRIDSRHPKHSSSTIPNTDSAGWIKNVALQNHETEFEAAERRIKSLPRCGAAKLVGMERSFHDLLEAVGEDPQRQGC